MTAFQVLEDSDIEATFQEGPSISLENLPQEQTLHACPAHESPSAEEKDELAGPVVRAENPGHICSPRRALMGDLKAQSELN